jgi:hypothetical protein
MRAWTRWLAGAAAVGVVAWCPAAGRAADKPTVEKTVPLEKNGRIPLDLELGPMRLLELVIQGAPADRALAAAQPPAEAFSLQTVVVATNTGTQDAEFRVTVAFLDDQGQAVFQCTDDPDQDEGVVAETHDVCSRVKGKRGDWARVTQVRFQARLEALE